MDSATVVYPAGREDLGREKDKYKSSEQWIIVLDFFYTFPSFTSNTMIFPDD